MMKLQQRQQSIPVDKFRAIESGQRRTFYSYPIDTVFLALTQIRVTKNPRFGEDSTSNIFLIQFNISGHILAGRHQADDQ
mmetsp:Transcript_18654/g.44893  ORF Transcript_18654/g.44893 Transcript_18654/m.44893 type:complete len:80 (-) Transcript_18654:752-991(-)